ncbi:MAG: substrate-binding periplasmic protein [Pseudomonadota bacterium]
MRRLPHLTLALLLPGASLLSSAQAGELLHFHYPDSGAPPYLYVTPGADKPTGIVVDVLETAARTAHRTVRYEFQPRENASAALRLGHANGALFFSATRPPAKDNLVSIALLRMESVLVTTKDKTINYRRPTELADRRLCTLTEEIYPPLSLLAMSGKLLQRKAKTEQAQLMMLRNEDCVAAIVNGPMYRWLAARYRWDDLRIESQPLLSEELVLGFAADEQSFLDVLNKTVTRLRKNGELGRIVQRHLPGAENLTTR